MELEELADVTMFFFDTPGGFTCKWNNTTHKPVAIQVVSDAVYIVRHDSSLVLDISVHDIRDVITTGSEVHINKNDKTSVVLIDYGIDGSRKTQSVAKTIRMRCMQADFEPSSPPPIPNDSPRRDPFIKTSSPIVSVSPSYSQSQAPATNTGSLINVIKDTTYTQQNVSPRNMNPKMASSFTSVGSVITPHAAHPSSHMKQRMDAYDNVIHLLEDLLLENRSTQVVVQRSSSPQGIPSTSLPHPSPIPTTSYPHAFKQQMQLHPRTLIGNFRAMTAVMDDAVATEIEEHAADVVGGDSPPLAAPLEALHSFRKTPKNVVEDDDLNLQRRGSMAGSEVSFSRTKRYGTAEQSQRAGGGGGGAATTEHNTSADVIDFDRLLLPLIPDESSPKHGVGHFSNTVGGGGLAGRGRKVTVTANSPAGAARNRIDLSRTAYLGVKGTGASSEAGHSRKSS